MRSSQSKIQTWLFLSLLGSSLEPVLIKYFRPDITPLTLIVLKSLVGTCFILPFYRRLKKLRTEDFIPVSQVAILAFITNTLIFVALQSIPATTLITVITITPLVVALFNHQRGMGKISFQFIVAFIAVFVGVLLTIEVLGKEKKFLLDYGIGIALVSVLTSAIYRLKMDSLTQKVDPFTVSVSLFFFNGVLSLLLLPLVNFSERAIPLGLWLGCAGVIANIFFLYAIKHLGSTRVSILSIIQRPLAIIFGAFLLNEIITPLQISGMALTFIGIYFAKMKPSQSNKKIIQNLS